MTKKRMHKNLILVFTAFFSVLMVTSCTTTSSRKSDSRAVADYDMQPAEFYLQQAEAAEEADRALSYYRRLKPTFRESNILKHTIY